MPLPSARAIIGASLLVCASAHAAQKTAVTVDDPSCTSEMKAELRSNLWERPAAPKPIHRPAMVSLSYRNDYGRRPRGLLIAVDGVVVRLSCDAEETGPIFNAPLAPGVHHFDAIYNFGFGRVGRSPLTFKVKPGKPVSLLLVIDRDDEEFPTAYLEQR